MRSATLYRGATAVVLPGEEDFGIVPVEAQACGRPVVALARGGALETVRDGVTGVLVPDADGRGASPRRFASLPDGGSTPAVIRRHAERFSRARFARQMRERDRPDGRARPRARGGKAPQPPARRLLRLFRRAARHGGVRARLRASVRERPDPDHEGLSRRSASTSTSCRLSACWCRSRSTCRGSIGCGAAARASTTSSPSSSAASSPSSSASSPRCTSRRTTSPTR